MSTVHIGNIIRDVIAEKRLTQVEVSSMISMTKQGLNGVLNKKSVNTDIIDRISRALEVNLYKVIAEKNTNVQEIESNTFSEPETVYKTKKKKKISILLEIDQDQQNQILKIIGL